MKILQNAYIKNSFQLPVKAKKIIILEHKNEINQIIPELQNSIILGGGSNILFTSNFLQKNIIIFSNAEIKIEKETPKFIDINVSAGKNWHQLVLWSVEQNLYGIENLVAIPGNAGAAPIQNIGAYGTEIKNSLLAVKGFNLINNKFQTLITKELNLSYRNSIFKNELKNKFLITDIVLRLYKNGKLNLSYHGVKEKLKKLNYKEPYSPKQVATAIENIRWSKLPKPEKLGNAGSFFKNPIISKNKFVELKNKIPDLKFYKISENEYKIPAAFLIEKAGWKGKRIQNVATYHKQPLIIVNHGANNGTEILKFAEKLKQEIKNKFNILLEYEVNII